MNLQTPVAQISEVWTAAFTNLRLLADQARVSERAPTKLVIWFWATHRQFTFLGNAHWPSISPDGLFVAYVIKEYGEKDKLVMQAMNGSVLELAKAESINDPRWSDSSELLFQQSDASTHGVLLVSRLGGAARRLGRGYHSCWVTTDGSQVAAAAVAVTSGFKEVWLTNKLAGERKDVRLSDYTFLHDIDCSPRSGLLLAVTQVSSRFEIRIFRPDGTGEQTLVDGNEEIYCARWSAAGDAIYYTHGKGSTEDFSRISIADSRREPTLVAAGLQAGEWFSHSMDDSRLAYTRENQNSNLWRLDLAAAGKKSAASLSHITSGTSYNGSPSFSPDGRWIAFPGRGCHQHLQNAGCWRGTSPVDLFFTCHDGQPGMVPRWPAHRLHQRSRRHFQSVGGQRRWRSIELARKDQRCGHEQPPCVVAES
jgi:WD40-like Beta Propeller Repeat